MEDERAKGKKEVKGGGKWGEEEESSRFSSEKEKKKEKKEETYKNPCPKSNSSSGTTSGKSRFPEKYLLAC